MKKPTDEQRRDHITAIVSEIEDLNRHLGLGPEAGDYEAFEILARIEARLNSKRPNHD